MAVISAAVSGLSVIRTRIPRNAAGASSGRVDRIWRGSDGISPRPTSLIDENSRSSTPATGLAASRSLAWTVVTRNGAPSASKPGSPAAAQSLAGWKLNPARPARSAATRRASFEGRELG